MCEINLLVTRKSNYIDLKADLLWYFWGIFSMQKVKDNFTLGEIGKI